VKEYLPIIIGAAVVLGVFAILWWSGYLVRLSNYVQETKEELRKCTWPTWDELKGSTVVVMISIAILGAYTVGVDFVLALVVRWMTQI
jgi:preprotein translocase subunit SecE